MAVTNASAGNACCYGCAHVCRREFIAFLKVAALFSGYSWCIKFSVSYVYTLYLSAQNVRILHIPYSYCELFLQRCYV